MLAKKLLKDMKSAKPLAYNPRTDGITQSLLSSFLKCRVYAKLNLEGWTSLKTGAALQFGEMAHGVLEDVYNEVQRGARKKPPTKEEVYGFIAGQVETWEQSPRGRRAGAEEVEQLELNAVLLEAVLPEYFKFWGKEDFTNIKWVDLEKEFEVGFDVTLEGKSVSVKLRGKIDGIYRDAGKALAEFETKTKGRIEEGNIQDFLAFDFQTDYYGIACEKIYGELPKTARYNIIRRPGEKLGKGETLDQYRERVSEKVKDNPKYYFLRYRIMKPKTDFEKFRKELKQKIQDFVDWAEGRLPTYRNETACQDRYGACRFLKICANGNYTGFYKRDKVFQEISNKQEGGK